MNNLFQACDLGAWHLACVVHSVLQPEDYVRKLILAGIVGVLLSPGLALARPGGNNNDQGENEDGGRPRIRAQEITEIGLAGAAVLGTVGYLLLRRRSARPKE